MPKLELGDLEAVARLKEQNIPELARLVDEGWDIVTPVPSCTLMFKQELPLMFPDDAQVLKVRDAMFDPFEYLWARYKGGLLRTDFTRKLGKISYHVPCHLRVQNLGLKTRDVLMLVPETQVEPIERCSGHNGTYGVKREYRDVSMKIGRPVVRRVADCGRGLLFERLPDGRPSDRIRAGATARADASAEAAADGVRDLNAHASARSHPQRPDEPRAVLDGAQGIPRQGARAQAQSQRRASGRTPPGRSRTG